MVARSHYMLIFWDRIVAYTQTLAAWIESHPEGINTDEPLAPELVTVVSLLHTLLAQTAEQVVMELQTYKACPQFRRFCVRLSEPDKPDDIQPSQYLVTGTIEAQLYLVMHYLVGEPGREEGARPLVDIHFGLELLDTFLRKHEYARGYITVPMEQAITKLSVLAECFIHLNMQPGNMKIMSDLILMFQSDDKHWTKHREAFEGWEKVFYTILNGKGQLISSPELGNPSDGKFEYPSGESRSKKKVVEALCKAEANLDAFWTHVDANIKKCSFHEHQLALKRLFEDVGGMYRTKPWGARHESTSNLPIPEAELHEPQPLSDLFHDSTKEITGNFNKTSLAAKTKEKTRGAPGNPEAEPEQERDPSPEATQVFTVNKTDHRIFKMLFHMPEDNATPIKKTTWRAFCTALTNLGFSAEHLPGSAWQFEPPAHLGLGRGISFHEPHPSDEIHLDMARKLGRRLNRAYGWHGAMFKAA